MSTAPVTTLLASENTSPSPQPVNPLLNLSIPKTTITIMAPPAASVSEHLPSTAKVSVTKPFKPKEGVATAHNLFAIEYMNNHPDTSAAAFSQVWKHIDEETKKKYELLEKSKRAAKGPSIKIPSRKRNDVNTSNTAPACATIETEAE